MLSVTDLAQFYRPGSGSIVQIENLVVGKSGITTYGQFKQCLRELFPRWTSLSSLKVPFENVRAEASAVTSAMELVHYYKLAVLLYEKLPKPLTADVIEYLECELLVAQIRYRAAIDYFTFDKLSQGTVEAAFALPLTVRHVLLSDLQNKVKTVEYAMFMDFDIPDTSNLQLSATQLKELIYDAFDSQLYERIAVSQDSYAIDLLENKTS